MAVRYYALERPGRIGTLELPHRILMGSMHLNLEGNSQNLSRLAAFYRERAEGGAALIITGGVAVVAAGGSANMFVLTETSDVAALAELAAAVHEVGGKIALQLFHSGRYARRDEVGETPVAPSAVPSRLTGEIPREMTIADIHETVDAFARGAEKAKSAGFDAVEVMGSEGYLLNEFLSPITNRRLDTYGGSVNERMRISLEVVSAIRSRVGGDYPVIFRMSGCDCMPDSTTQAETLEFAKSLEEAGVDALNVGIGWHESRVPTVQQVVPRGAFASIARCIRQNVHIPVIGANRINVPELADELIAGGYLDFIAPARPWLADGHFARKALAGDRAGLNVCIACNQACLDNTLVRPYRPVSCLVNPRAGVEQMRPITKVPVARRVAVVGAGPAGLQAAVTAAQRGHEVVLFEELPEVGGQFRMAARIPGKAEFYETIGYFEEQLRRLQVEVRLRTRPKAAELATFDDVILAQGVKPHMPQIPGISMDCVVTYPQILRGEVQPGTDIVIVGAGGIGCDVATYLAHSWRLKPEASAFFRQQHVPEPAILGRNITVLSRSERYGKGIGGSSRWVVKQEMKRLGVEVKLNFAIESIAQDRVTGHMDGQRVEIPADQVVICTGQDGCDTLSNKLEGQTQVHVVGGARESTGINAARAMREAFEVAYSL